MEETFKEQRLDSIQVARAIRYAAKTQSELINMTQIHKLLYITYSLCLVKYKTRLTEEHPSAWPHGPVFPRVYKNVKLTEDISSSDYDSLKLNYPYVIELIDFVVHAFGGFTAGQLSEWSHQEDSPWDTAVRANDFKWNSKLSDEDIYSYFYNFLRVEESDQQHDA